MVEAVQQRLQLLGGTAQPRRTRNTVARPRQVTGRSQSGYVAGEDWLRHFHRESFRGDVAAPQLPAYDRPPASDVTIVRRDGTHETRPALAPRLSRGS
ncbi:hypothetical protein GCM10020367_71770 [Streptomyces sannanensis]|uniref:Uncharacterized protein n=1 Tax=Streptomyces sannanensis TaxID=285536 RepID=A0ABP6SP63_9ACTN